MNDLDYIRKVLNQGAISQNQLAKESGVSQRTISNISRGIGSPRFANVVALKAALDRLIQPQPAPRKRRPAASTPSVGVAAQ